MHFHAKFDQLEKYFRFEVVFEMPSIEKNIDEFDDEIAVNDEKTSSETDSKTVATVEKV